jgi:chaperonin GroEL
MLQDLAIVTGAQLISDDLGKKMEAVTLEELGHVHRVVSTKDSTTFVGGKGDKKEIEKRVAQLRNQIKEIDSDYDKEKLQERLGKLSGGVAVIKVGAPTESAQKELKQRVEDAVAATRAAMEEGIVPGGGVALFNALMEVEKGWENSKSGVAAILKRALEAPITAIALNSGESPSKVIQELRNRKAGEIWRGFNAVKNELDDLKLAGIIDPLKVTKTALTNAISVASNYLMIGAAVSEIPKKDEPAHDHSHGGGMGY